MLPEATDCTSRSYNIRCIQYVHLHFILDETPATVLSAGPSGGRPRAAAAPILNRRGRQLVVKRLARVWLCCAAIGFGAATLLALIIALVVDRAL